EADQDVLYLDVRRRDRGLDWHRSGGGHGFSSRFGLLGFLRLSFRLRPDRSTVVVRDLAPLLRRGVVRYRLGRIRRTRARHAGAKRSYEDSRQDSPDHAHSMLRVIVSATSKNEY